MNKTPKLEQWQLLVLGCLLWLLLGTGNQVHGQDVLVLEAAKSYSLSANMEVLVDSSRAMALAEVQESNGFQPLLAGRANFEFGPQAYWFRLKFENRSEVVRWVFRQGNNFLDSVHLYVPHPEKGWEVYSLGDEHLGPGAMIRHQSVGIDLHLGQGATKEVYIRMASETLLSIEFFLEPRDIFFESSRFIDLFYAFFGGFLFLVIISNAFLYFTLRDRAFLIYVCYMLVIAWNVSTFSGFFQEWYLPRWGHLPNELFLLQISLVSLLCLLFAKYFLRIYRYSPVLVGPVNALLYLHLLYFPLIFLLDYGTNLAITQIFTTATIFISLLMGVYVYLKGHKAALYYAVGYICYFLGIFLVQLDFFGLTDKHFFSSHGFEIGTMFEVVFLSMALAVRYQQEREQSQQAQQKAQSDMLVLQERTNRELEQKVQERTQELQDKNEEVATQNEELQQQQDELMHQSERLWEQKKKIEQQNQALAQYNETLEQKVADRTRLLQQANTTLATQLKQLEQFSFIVAHNLRGPLARLLGLTNLFSKYDLGSDDKVAVVSQISENAQHLDTVVHDLNKILYVRTNQEEAFEEVSVREAFNKVLAVLSDSIERIGAKVAFVGDDALKIRSIPAYLESILQNLIANGLQFSHPDHPAEINVMVMPVNKYLSISVADNGQGMDLAECGEQLFGLYQRFHGKQSGRGIGLYLVRTQAQALGGSVSVESGPDKGTVFTVNLPLRNTARERSR